MNSVALMIINDFSLFRRCRREIQVISLHVVVFSKNSSSLLLSLDMSTRDRFKIINDIFDMIPENDEDIQFDQHGILKITKLSISNDDLPTMRISNADWFRFDCPGVQKKKHFFFLFSRRTKKISGANQRISTDLLFFSHLFIERFRFHHSSFDVSLAVVL